MFNGFTKQTKVHYDCFETLGEVSHAILDMLQEDYESGLAEIQSIVVAGQMLYTFSEGKRMQMSSQFEMHPIFEKSDMWKLSL